MKLKYVMYTIDRRQIKNFEKKNELHSSSSSSLKALANYKAATNAAGAVAYKIIIIIISMMWRNTANSIFFREAKNACMINIGTNSLFHQFFSPL